MDVRTFRSAVERGDLPAPSRMIGNRPEWRRAEIVAWLRSIAVEQKAVSDLVDMLSDMRDDKRTGIGERTLAAEILTAVCEGADPKQILEELRSAGAL
jgi:hypothetical protein